MCAPVCLCVCLAAGSLVEEITPALTYPGWTDYTMYCIYLFSAWKMKQILSYNGELPFYKKTWGLINLLSQRMQSWICWVGGSAARVQTPDLGLQKTTGWIQVKNTVILLCVCVCARLSLCLCESVFSYCLWLDCAYVCVFSLLCCIVSF